MTDDLTVRSDDWAPRSPVRVVVVGVGRFGRLHTRVWREAGAAVVGVVDIDAARARQVAATLGGVPSDTDAAALVRRTEPDAVVVASDEDSHVSIARAALDAGCHVFVEKPFAQTPEDARALHQRACEVGREVIAGHISRFAQPYVLLREAVAADRIGDLWTIRLRRDFSRAWFASFGDRVHPAWESCIHDIDLAVYYAGCAATRVYAQQSRAAGEAGPSVVSALVEFASGVTATIESAWTVPHTAPQTESGALELAGSIVAEAELHGSQGIARQRLLNDGLTVWSDRDAWSPNPFLWPQTGGSVGGALRAEVDHALSVFSGQRPNTQMPMQEAVWGIDIAAALVRSLDTRAPVELPAS